METSNYPEELVISRYWKLPGRGASLLREALDAEHPENLWNWFKREYPNIPPHLYGVKDPKLEPVRENYSHLSREELYEYIYKLEKQLENIEQYF